MQHSSHLLMIQPVQFEFNSETAVNNSFQVNSTDENVQQKAQKEFDQLIQKLRQNGSDITLVKDTPVPHTPDSVFPNNWISFHENATICLYPMFAKNRRMERKQSVLDALQAKFLVQHTIDLTSFEEQSLFLEGTGSMVLDRVNKIAFACLSPRTDPAVLENFCEQLNYHPVAFCAVDEQQQPIYHTNVMMCVADKYAVICSESIADEAERNMVLGILAASGKAIIEISYNQMNHFAGNMLQVHNQSGQQLLVMSSQAYFALNEDQISLMEHYNPIIHSDITTIETNGGGSARCMMAEIFLPLK